MAFDNWDQLLQKFRALGGVFDNLEVRTEDGRRGLFPVDRASECRLFVPKALFVRAEDVRLVDGRMTIAPAAAVAPETAAFFADYHALTSWSDGGRSSLERWLGELQQLPAACRDLLIKDLGLAQWFEPASEEVVLRHFLRVRRVDVDEVNYLVPVLELSNHDPLGPRLDVSAAGLGLKGVFPGEFAWRYRMADAFQMFRGYQFASPERFTFSLPFDVFDKRLGKNIHIAIDTSSRQVRQAAAPIPVLKRTATSIELSFLLLGDRGDPRNGYRSFKGDVAPELGVNELEFFEGLLFYNRQKFMQLLKSVEDDNSPAAPLIRKVCRFQLEGLSLVSFQ